MALIYIGNYDLQIVSQLQQIKKKLIGQD